MEIQRFFVRLAYKGSAFSGWQIQPNASSVQETIMEALKKINRGTPVKLTGCGRTDTGVHATEFYAHFDLAPSHLPETAVHKLNCMLPAEIVIDAIHPVKKDLHSRFSATERTYHYFIHTEKSPFLTDTSWFLRRELDLDKMNAASRILLRTKNFKSFSKTITGDSSFECDLRRAEWTKTADGYQFTVSANRFLRNMVRALVGTLIEIGIGNVSLSDFEEIIASKNRSQAGTSAPAHGLFLANVAYENDPEIRTLFASEK